MQWPRNSARIALYLSCLVFWAVAFFSAMTAVGKGLDAYVAVDASGTFSETRRQAELLRMPQAGVILSDYATLMVEILKDNARPEAGEVYGASTWAGPSLLAKSPRPTK